MKDITSRRVLSGSFSRKTLNNVMNSILVCFGEIILITLQYIYLIILVVKDTFLELSTYLSLVNFSIQDIPLIKKTVPSFTKVPLHLTLILGPESPSYKDLLKLIKWCFPAGISHISFYDHKNSLDPQVLFETVSSYGKNYIPNIKWGKTFSHEIKTKSKKLINGFSWNPLLHVHVYRREDGLENLQETVLYLHRQGVEHIDQASLNEVMRKHLEAPDPDLALICGPYLSCYGFPPWHLRITSLYRISSHHKIQASTFLKFLKKYNVSEQRYGK